MESNISYERKGTQAQTAGTSGGYSFIQQQFSVFLLGTQCVAGTVLGPQDIKPDMIPG